MRSLRGSARGLGALRAGEGAVRGNFQAAGWDWCESSTGAGICAGDKAKRARSIKPSHWSGKSGPKREILPF
ncbi:hypothetical protein [Campylobacter sp.]|uniref:hypothetical protein n=1 Tax=Campylobacter sp. TaxID=205 RepID=UPI0026DCA983|nr:hypothetical protein [Campylobacter sp.]MDO4674725.1 hypothetical protein [Campylobacter sp.]